MRIMYGNEPIWYDKLHVAHFLYGFRSINTAKNVLQSFYKSHKLVRNCIRCSPVYQLTYLEQGST